LEAPAAALVSIGEEVLRGEVVDTNRAFLVERLSALGFRVAAGFTVGDREADIVEALERAAGAAPLVVATGGLGPTGDDISAVAAARFAGVGLIESPEALKGIARRLGCRPDEIGEPRRCMALVPAGARALPNPRGAAPGIYLGVRGPGFGVQEKSRSRGGEPNPEPRTPDPEVRHLFLLPGVPGEMRAIFEESVAPELEKVFPDRPRRRARMWHVSGWPESEADATARETLGALLAPGRLELGTKLGGGWVSLRAAGEGPEAARLIEEAGRLLASRFGDALWGEGAATIEEVAARALLDRGLKLALAESCTGGLIASRLVSFPGISAALLEALVTYGDESKTRLLGVDPELIETHGAVSRECAEAMARGLRTRCGADITLAVTGIAGPSGGQPEKPVGTVHFAVDGPGGTLHEVRRFGGERQWVRRRAASHGLWMIWRAAAGR